MNREVSFKAKGVKTGKWAEGYCVYSLDRSKAFIVGSFIYNGEIEDFDLLYLEVQPETIGQFIEHFDMNGKRIFEGDLIKDMSGNVAEVFYSKDHCAFMCRYRKDSNGRKGIWRLGSYSMNDIEVIGNIHDKQD